MKKYVFLFQGWGEPTDETKKAWMDWFDKVGPSIVDGGNPFATGRKVTPSGSEELSFSTGAITGYTIFNADSMDDAEKLLDGCPMLDGVLIYEAAVM